MDFQDREAANHSQAYGHVCTHHSGREDTAGHGRDPCTITVPLWSIAAHSQHTTESERPRSALAVAIRVSWCTGMAATAYSVALLGGARLPAAPRSALLPRRSVCQLRLQGND